MAVLLQVGGGDVPVDLAFDRAFHHRSLVLAGGDQGDLAGLEDGRHAHGDGLHRNVLRPEEVGRRRAPRDGVEDHEPGARAGAGAGLVEADVPGLSDPQDLEVDAARVLDGMLVVAAVRLDLVPRQVAARDVHVLRIEVYVLEEILPHEPVVAVQAVRSHRVVLVEVEGHDVRKIEAFLTMEPDQLAVDADRRRAGSEPQHGPLPGLAPGADELGHALCDLPRDRLVGLRHGDGNAFRIHAHAPSTDFRVHPAAPAPAFGRRP